MLYTVKLSNRASNEFKRHEKSGRKIIIEKINRIIILLSIDPRDPKIGKPERLKYTKEEIWSRKIDERHRMVYKIDGSDVTIKSLWGHYEDK